MPITFKKIASVTVGSGGAASIDFQNIPQTYDDLKLLLSIRSDRSGTTLDSALIRFNNSTANLSQRILEGTGSAATSSSGTTGYIGLFTGATATASTFSSLEVYVPNYRGSTNKSFSSDAVHETNATAAYQTIVAGLWSQTTAIDRITIVPNTGPNVVQYSTATLYGISKS